MTGKSQCGQTDERNWTGYVLSVVLILPFSEFRYLVRFPSSEHVRPQSLEKKDRSACIKAIGGSENWICNYSYNLLFQLLLEPSGIDREERGMFSADGSTSCRELLYTSLMESIEVKEGSWAMSKVIPGWGRAGT